MVHYLLTRKSMMKRENKPSKPPWTYFWRVTSPQEQPQAGPSGHIPEEGIVITDDSSKQVIASEDPPVGQDVDVEDSDIDDPDPE